MPSCKYCGNIESSDWNMAGFVCSECRHSCPTCGKDDQGFPASQYSAVKYEGEKMFWCAGCGQLIPTEFITDVDTPVTDEDVQRHFNERGILGVTTEDADGAPDDARGAVDVPTYDV